MKMMLVFALLLFPQEQWRKEVKQSGVSVAPADGNLAVTFPKEFEAKPSCSVEGPTLPGELLTVTTKGFSIKVKPNGRVKWECTLGSNKPS